MALKIAFAVLFLLLVDCTKPQSLNDDDEKSIKFLKEANWKEIIDSGIAQIPTTFSEEIKEIEDNFVNVVEEVVEDMPESIVNPISKMYNGIKEYMTELIFMFVMLGLIFYTCYCCCKFYCFRKHQRQIERLARTVVV